MKREKFHKSFIITDWVFRSIRGKSKPHLDQGNAQFLSIQMSNKTLGVTPRVRLIMRARTFAGIEGVVEVEWEGFFIRRLSFKL